MIEVTNIELSVKLKELGICKPSYYFYEWTGATDNELERATVWGYFPDNVNAYSATSLKRLLPKNVAVNENVREIGYQPTDNKADKLARLLIYMIDNNQIIMDEKYMLKRYGL